MTNDALFTDVMNETRLEDAQTLLLRVQRECSNDLELDTILTRANGALNAARLHIREQLKVKQKDSTL